MTAPVSGRLPDALIPLMLIWTRRRLLADSVALSLRQRYAGAILGLAWLVLGPVMLLSLYAVIYLVVFRVRPPGMPAEMYVLYIFAGLVPFLNFSQGLVQATMSLSADKEVLLNTVFPPELIPLREVAAAFAKLLLEIVLICVVAAVVHGPSWTWLLLFPVLLLLMAFLAGVTWMLSLANLVFKDIQQLLTYVTIMLLVATPIAYTPDMLPAALRVLIYFNPMAYFVICIQSLLVLQVLPPWPIALGAAIFGTATPLIGAHVFSRAKTVFFDYA